MSVTAVMRLCAAPFRRRALPWPCVEQADVHSIGRHRVADDLDRALHDVPEVERGVNHLGQLPPHPLVGFVRSISTTRSRASSRTMALTDSPDELDLGRRAGEIDPNGEVASTDRGERVVEHLERPLDRVRAPPAQQQRQHDQRQADPDEHDCEADPARRASWGPARRRSQSPTSANSATPATSSKLRASAVASSGASDEGEAATAGRPPRSVRRSDADVGHGLQHSPFASRRRHSWRSLRAASHPPSIEPCAPPTISPTSPTRRRRSCARACCGPNDPTGCCAWRRPSASGARASPPLFGLGAARYGDRAGTRRRTGTVSLRRARRPHRRDRAAASSRPACDPATRSRSCAAIIATSSRSSARWPSSGSTRSHLNTAIRGPADRRRPAPRTVGAPRARRRIRRAGDRGRRRAPPPGLDRRPRAPMSRTPTTACARSTISRGATPTVPSSMLPRNAGRTIILTSGTTGPPKGALVAGSPHVGAAVALLERLPYRAQRDDGRRRAVLPRVGLGQRVDEPPARRHDGSRAQLRPGAHARAHRAAPGRGARGDTGDVAAHHRAARRRARPLRHVVVAVRAAVGIGTARRSRNALHGRVRRRRVQPLRLDGSGVGLGRDARRPARRADDRGTAAAGHPGAPARRRRPRGRPGRERTHLREGSVDVLRVHRRPHQVDRRRLHPHGRHGALRPRRAPVRRRPRRRDDRVGRRERLPARGRRRDRASSRRRRGRGHRRSRCRVRCTVESVRRRPRRRRPSTPTRCATTCAPTSPGSRCRARSSSSTSSPATAPAK